MTSNLRRIQVTIPAGLEDIVPQYLEAKQNELGLYSSWIRQKNFIEIEKASHKLKGSAGGYGFDELGRMARDLNIAAKSQDFARAGAILEEMRIYLEGIELVPEDS